MEFEWKKEPGYRKLKPEGQYTPIDYVKMDSLAWRKANPMALKLYMKMTTFNDIKHIVFTYKQANEYCKVSKATFKKCIDELVKLGFIDILSSGKCRKPNIYALSSRWKLYGEKVYLDKYESRGNNFFDTDDLDSE